MEQVQTILEGRCLECAERLPNHTIRCPLNPQSQLSAGIARIQQGLDDKIEQITTLLNENKISVEEFEDLIRKISYRND